jgi:hypothetical protein
MSAKTNDIEKSAYTKVVSLPRQATLVSDPGCIGTNSVRSRTQMTWVVDPLTAIRCGDLAFV